jgi:hypothetical protein
VRIENPQSLTELLPLERFGNSRFVKRIFFKNKELRVFGAPFKATVHDSAVVERDTAPRLNSGETKWRMTSR